jgi:hypothetical protein
VITPYLLSEVRAHLTLQLEYGDGLFSLRYRGLIEEIMHTIQGDGALSAYSREKLEVLAKRGLHMVHARANGIYQF